MMSTRASSAERLGDLHHLEAGDAQIPHRRPRGAPSPRPAPAATAASASILFRSIMPNRQGERYRLPESRGDLLRKARHQHSARHDRQRILLQISQAFGRACKRLGLKHIRTRPYTPKTNGKAERFIQTALREWAYAEAYQRSDASLAQGFRVWLHRYNWHRPRWQYRCQSLPISRLGLTGNNLLRLHS